MEFPCPKPCRLFLVLATVSSAPQSAEVRPLLFHSEGSLMSCSRQHETHVSLGTGHRALDSVFKLSLGRRHTTTTFLSRLSDRFLVPNSGNCNDVDNQRGMTTLDGDSVTALPMAKSRESSLLHMLMGVVKRGLSLGRAGLRCGSTTMFAILVTAVCVFTVAAANGVPARPTRLHQGKYNDTTSVKCTASTVTKSSDGSNGSSKATIAGGFRVNTPWRCKLQRWRKKRLDRLIMTPRFSPAYTSWRALRDRRKVHVRVDH